MRRVVAKWSRLQSLSMLAMRAHGHEAESAAPPKGPPPHPGSWREHPDPIPKTAEERAKLTHAPPFQWHMIAPLIFLVGFVTTLTVDYFAQKWHLEKHGGYTYQYWGGRCIYHPPKNPLPEGAAAHSHH